MQVTYNSPARYGWPGGIDGEPVGVGSVEVLVGAVGVHAGEDEQAVLVGGLGEFAVEVAVAQISARWCSGNLLG